MGLITKHGILMVEFANELKEKHGLGRREAIEEAARVRLRPILMTTAAMVLGVAPLLYASGAGAAARFSMGLVIASGMSIGTIFTLFVVPMFYTFISRETDASRSRRRKPQVPHGPSRRNNEKAGQMPGLFSFMRAVRAAGEALPGMP